ncbi:MAG: DUF1614 domain-containing protein [Chitinivibrionales bacterium]|nr:DUF1614 domain-containing protein [Chitinivibrionales bacterium]
MLHGGAIALLLFVFLLFLFPLFLADLMLTALDRLGLEPEVSLLAAIGIFLGGIVNIPVRRIRRDNPMDYSTLQMYGIHRILPQLIQQRNYTTIAVNAGGCLVPASIALYQIYRIATQRSEALVAVLGASAINIVVCHIFARPVPGVGIALSPIIPTSAAVLCGLFFIPELAPVIAFVAGVTGPLIGADLLNLDKIARISTGVASIGGAGTFDGIVISGFLSTLLVW